MIARCKEFGIRKIPTCPYYPKGKGLIERSFRTMKERLYATTKEKKVSWVEAVPYVELGLRATKNSTIDMSSCNAVFGRNVFACQKADLGNRVGWGKFAHFF